MTGTTSLTRAERQRLERDVILRAAFGLIGRSRDEAVSVQQILDSAELSTRAFYRHFRSKDELILTMFRTAADRVAAEMSEVIARADGPAAAVEAWIHRQLAVVYDPKRARQTSVLTSAEARAAVGFDQVDQEAATVRRTMLAEVIRRGKREGAFPLAEQPDEDARAVTSVVGGLIQARLVGDTGPGWAEATLHTTRLFLRAFGAANT